VGSWEMYSSGAGLAANRVFAGDGGVIVSVGAFFVKVTVLVEVSVRVVSCLTGGSSRSFALRPKAGDQSDEGEEVPCDYENQARRQTPLSRPRRVRGRSQEQLAVP